MGLIKEKIKQIQDKIETDRIKANEEKLNYLNQRVEKETLLSNQRKEINLAQEKIDKLKAIGKPKPGKGPNTLVSFMQHAGTVDLIGKPKSGKSKSKNEGFSGFMQNAASVDLIGDKVKFGYAPKKRR